MSQTNMQLELHVRVSKAPVDNFSLNIFSFIHALAREC